ncbi:MAG TPA: class I SAM-dependent methyltransferase [Candidatus Limnocylindria bacterium]|nr:class I SAM-dependent methyltransferase [Candidatus Limnocylindria bacterium]
MTVAPRVSTLGHWESYWRGHANLDQTYSTGDRLVREILADGPVAGRPVLEVGAGSGRDTLGLVRAGATGVVLDYSPTSLELVRRQARDQGVVVHLVRADALALPFRDHTFEIVFHQGLLEHFRDPNPLLRENARVTRHGGRVVVDVPQTFHAYTVMKQTLIAFNAWFAGWETQFTPAELERTCQAAGLAVRRTYGDWMVPGLGYRVVREVLKRALRLVLPLEPKGPAWWQAMWEGWRRGLRHRRWALYTCHVIGTVAEKP